MDLGVDCSQFPGRLKEICEGSAKKSNGKPFSIRERKTIIGKRLSLNLEEGEISLIHSNRFDPNKPDVSFIGTILHEIIRDRTGNEIPCSDCLREIKRLNTMTSQQVLSEVDSLSKKITERSKKNAQKWYQRLAATYLPELVQWEVKKLIREACEKNDEKKKQEVVWEYGITTVLSRRDIEFPRTLHSIQSSGFDHPRLFIDGCTPSQASMYDIFELPVTCRDRVRTAANWVLSLYELWTRNPNADRYAIFQDDFVCVRNLRTYLEESPYPEKGYQNLYTFPANESLKPDGKYGWYKSNQLGYGAVALVFNNEAVMALLGQNYLVERFKDADRGHRAIDGGIVEAMKAVGWSEYVHSPCLIQHIGDVSSMGNSRHAKALSFRGESFDALSLLK
jgi:hypothetical protein